MSEISIEETSMTGSVDPGTSQSLWARMISWISSIGARGGKVEKGALIMEKELLLRILPHRGRMLLLDRVVVTTQKVMGFFQVTQDVCEGHAIGGQAVFRGVEFAEMANQLLGVWFASQNPEFIGSGRVLFAREGAYKASGFVQPGDLVVMEVDYQNLSGEMKVTRRGTFTEVTGKNFLLKVGEDLKGSVPLVVLKGVEPPKTTTKTS